MTDEGAFDPNVFDSEVFDTVPQGRPIEITVSVETYNIEVS